MENMFRTFIYKIGDVEADTKIHSILSEGWKISAVTPNGSVRITTFNKDYALQNSTSVAEKTAF